LFYHNIKTYQICEDNVIFSLCKRLNQFTITYVKNKDAMIKVQKLKSSKIKTNI